MSNRIPTGIQIPTIIPFAPINEQSFDLNRLDIFVTSLGVDFMHYKAMPSTIGQSDIGDYRRSDGVDTITSNGMLYQFGGIFTATIVDNQRQENRNDGGIYDPSQSRLIMPRFYNNAVLADGPRIYLAPGDRVYIADPNADTQVANYEKMEFNPNFDNITMFPISTIDGNIIDSKNQTYQPNIDFIITASGNIKWLSNGNNPGINPETGRGNIYSVRYLYRAFWYVTTILKEVRITNITAGNIRSPQRMPFEAIVTREYLYHNKNKGDTSNPLKPKTPSRTQEAPTIPQNPNQYYIPVDMSNIEHGEDTE